MFKKMNNKCATANCDGHYYFNKKSKAFACNKCGALRKRSGLVSMDYGEAELKVLAQESTVVREKL